MYASWEIVSLGSIYQREALKVAVEKGVYVACGGVGSWYLLEVGREGGLTNIQIDSNDDGLPERHLDWSVDSLHNQLPEMQRVRAQFSFGSYPLVTSQTAQPFCPSIQDIIGERLRCQLDDFGIPKMEKSTT